MKEMYTPKELAKKWNISYINMINMINRGQVKAFKVGNLWRIKAEEVARVENGKQ